MSKVKEQNYVVIQGWMLSKLQLKGNDLLIYAIIYGFSQNTDCKFTGSLQYLADWTNSTKQGCLNSLKNLLDKKLITKKDYIINGVKFVEYYSNDFNEVVKKVEQGYSNDFNGGSQETLPNNTNDKLIDNSININDKANTASGFSNKKENPTISSLENVQPVVKENLTTQKPKQEVHFPQEFIEFYEGYEGKHPSKQKQTATTVLKKWKIMRKTYTNAEILLQVKQYAEYLQNAPWRDKKGIQFVSEKFLFEGDWIEKKLIQETKQKKPTFNNQYAKTKPDYLEVQKRYAATGELQLSTTYRKRRD